MILTLLCFQGDKEAELGLPFSPLCDRKSTMVAQSQIGKCFLTRQHHGSDTRGTLSEEIFSIVTPWNPPPLLNSNYMSRCFFPPPNLSNLPLALKLKVTEVTELFLSTESGPRSSLAGRTENFYSFQQRQQADFISPARPNPKVLWPRDHIPN